MRRPYQILFKSYDQDQHGISKSHIWLSIMVLNEKYIYKMRRWCIKMIISQQHFNEHWIVLMYTFANSKKGMQSVIYLYYYIIIISLKLITQPHKTVIMLKRSRAYSFWPVSPAICRHKL
jgi:hypothetical protein